MFAVVSMCSGSWAWTNGQDAGYVIGQEQFATRVIGVSSTQLSNPYDVAVDHINDKLYVLDGSNNRVLRYSLPITANQPAAELVFGQPDFTSMASGTTSKNFNGPRGIAVDSEGRLWVSEYSNNRVVWFNEAYAISTNQPEADGVLGQPDFTSHTGVTSSSGLKGGYGIAIDSTGSLYVADWMNNRVLRWDNAAGKANGAAADGVLGQTDFTSSSPGSTAGKFSSSRGVALVGTTLFVADRNNSRVLRFDNAKYKVNGADADGVLGQDNFTTTDARLTQSGMETPSRLAAGDGRLYVSDGFNYDRVVIFENVLSKADGAAADYVLGQPDFTTSGAGVAANRISLDSSAGGMAVNPFRREFYLADFANNRVLIFQEPAPATPEISLRQGQVLLASGALYDFGELLPSQQDARTFTISNSGTDSLSLGGTPSVQLTDDSAFSVTQPASSSVTSGDSVTFTIIFEPNTSGDHSAQLSIANSDPDENPFILNLAGKGEFAPIPTLSEWGVMVLSALLVGVMLWQRRRQPDSF